MRKLTVALAIECAQLHESAQHCLLATPTRVVADTRDLQDIPALVDRIERLAPDVVILDISHAGDSLERILQSVKQAGCAPFVIAVNTSPDPTPILAALRAGANEYLYAPIEAGLTKALERVAAETREDRLGSGTRGRVLGFTSAKGGCGATTLACQLGAELARRKTGSVLLADLDFEAGLVRFLMKTGQQYSILDALKNVHRLDKSYWKAVVTTHRSGLDVLTPPPAPACLDADPEQLQSIIGFARFQYSQVLVDLGRGVSGAARGILSDMDTIFIVTSLDLLALERTRVLADTLEAQGFDRERLRAVVNRVPRKTTIQESSLRDSLGIAVFATVPDDQASVTDALLEGKLSGPGSLIGKQIANFAQALAATAMPEPVPVPRFARLTTSTDLTV
jgi:pilus assembly protein CpaE